MTRSIFDPAGGETERSGNRFTSPDAEQLSHLPTDVQDGIVEASDDETIVPGNLGTPAASPPDGNKTVTEPDSNPGVEAPSQRTVAAGNNAERPAPGRGVE